MIMGRVISHFEPESDLVEMLEKISKLNLDSNEKKLLLVLTQHYPKCLDDSEEAETADNFDEDNIFTFKDPSRMDSILFKLQEISSNGTLNISWNFSSVVREKIDELNKIDSEELKKIAKSLIKKIESSEIKLW